MASTEYIEVRGARGNNLKGVSLRIPKRQLTVFTGVSGSGKSSLVFGTIAAESQRLINETFPMYVQSLLPRYGQPDVDALDNISAAIIVDQQRLGGNSRSTVGTVTDTYTMLRQLFARNGSGEVHTASGFSFNDPQGMCPECEGIGQVSGLDVDALVDKDKSINEGPFRFPTFAVNSRFWSIIANCGFFNPDKKLRDYTEDEWYKLVHLGDTKIKIVWAGKTFNATYEGLIPRFKLNYLSKGPDQLQPHVREAYQRVVTTVPCDLCGGTRLSQAALASTIDGKNIAECAAMEVAELATFVGSMSDAKVAPLTAALARRLQHLADIGLGYLSLDRETTTLSGGESQRVKMVRHLGSSLTDIIYIFDEPTVGLHPHDVHLLNDLLLQLRDKGNTVLVVEHKPEVMAIADHVVDMGPGAGRAGGEVTFEGTYKRLTSSKTLTGTMLTQRAPVKTDPRRPTGKLRIENANLHNLRDVTVEIGEGVLTVVTGVAGSGKSSLIHGCLPKSYPNAVFIDQSVTRGSKRSNPATYTGMLEPIRKAFASANKVSPALFSANSKGACPDCQGLGLIYTDLAQLDPVVTVCETCEGRRFTDEVLQHTLRGRNISEVLQMSVVEAAEYFTEAPILSILKALDDVGLGYMTLWQPLSTLSGGERQRLKLATELGKTAQLYVLDEPTAGLHMNDVETLIGLLDRLVEQGSTVIVIEHNLDVIARADWVIDLGPGAGHEGGKVMFEGPVAKLLTNKKSTTARYLRARQGG